MSLRVTSEPIRDEQELLARFVRTAQTTISEYSTSFASDTAALIEIVTEYADAHELKVEPEWFETFYSTYPEQRRA